LATKTQIKHAIEELFNVKVEAVATQNRGGKARRYKARARMTKAWKKAVVKLGSEYKIDFF
jgi:large subunit ribosomal protein L23